MLVAAGVLGVLAGGAAARGVVDPGREEFVAVAHLDPLLVIAVNVVSGRLQISGDDVGFKDGPVAVIEDPIGHRLFRYVGGLPGLAPAPPSPFSAALPLWGAPRVLRRSGTVVGIRLPDGRRISVVSGRSGRVYSLTWRGARGGRLHSTIGYSGLDTTITDPFGVSRTYVHDRQGHAYELVPTDWRGTGYRHWRSPILDSTAETMFVQSRTALGTPARPALLDSVQAAAGRAFGVIWLGAPANDGYVNVGVSETRPIPRIIATLKRVGLLDVTDLSTVFDTATELDAAQAALNRRLDAMFKDCHLSDGQQVDDIDVDITTNVTVAETAALEDALHALNAWAVVRQAGTSQCATLSRG